MDGLLHCHGFLCHRYDCTFCLVHSLMNDFSKFTFFVKGLLEVGTVIKYSDRKPRQDVKLHFNRLMNDAAQFEKFLHQQFDQDMIKAEENINHSIIDLVWQIFEMDDETLTKFTEHINNFKKE